MLIKWCWCLFILKSFQFSAWVTMTSYWPFTKVQHSVKEKKHLLTSFKRILIVLNQVVNESFSNKIDKSIKLNHLELVHVRSIWIWEFLLLARISGWQTSFLVPLLFIFYWNWKSSPIHNKCGSTLDHESSTFTSTKVGKYTFLLDRGEVPLLHVTQKPKKENHWKQKKTKVQQNFNGRRGKIMLWNREAVRFAHGSAGFSLFSFSSLLFPFSAFWVLKKHKEFEDEKE